MIYARDYFENLKDSEKQTYIHTLIIPDEQDEQDEQKYKYFIRGKSEFISICFKYFCEVFCLKKSTVFYYIGNKSSDASTEQIEQSNQKHKLTKEQVLIEYLQNTFKPEKSHYKFKSCPLRRYILNHTFRQVFTMYNIFAKEAYPDKNLLISRSYYSKILKKHYLKIKLK